jgi:diguanylate cyclase (GGDEF)-like protein
VPPDQSTDSYRRLADVFHDLLSEQSLEALLERIGAALAEIVFYEALTIYEVDEPNRRLTPILARGNWTEEIMRNRPGFGEGLTGWAAEHLEPVLANEAHLDPRVANVPGTPVEPEALIVVPLAARGALKGTLNIYRLGEDAHFDEVEFELARRFADAAALALDNAQVRARLEHQAQTDSLTGLYNHRHFHERLRAELARAGRTGDTVALLMLDFDDFKRVNDVHGHGAGDAALVTFANLLRTLVRSSDVVCRVGGEEFGVVMPSSVAADAVALGERLRGLLAETELSPDGPLALSIGVAEGPAHAMNGRELAACAESSMMTAKAAGGDSVVVFADADAQRPGAPTRGRDARSIAHLKMLQSLSGKLNRLNDVHAIGAAIVTELRALVDYHTCRAVLVDGDELRQIAFRGERGNPDLGPEAVACRVGEGITGRVAATGESILVGNVRDCDFRLRVPGTQNIDETIAAVPLRYGARVIGVIVVSKLAADQFDRDDVRLLEVLAGHASVALENARLFEEQSRTAKRASESAEIAHALLQFSRALAATGGREETADRVVAATASLVNARRAALWLDDGAGAIRLLAAVGEAARALSSQFPLEMGLPFLTRTEPFEFPSNQLQQFGVKPPPGTTYFVAPITVEARLGCLVVAVATDAEPTRTLRLLAGVADQAALALTSAGNWEALEGMFVSTVEVLANALEAKDEYTSSHARWICDAAIAVGRELGVEGEGVRHLEYAALFHDIGKMGIPNDVLLKPGPLTPEERAIVERHPEIGQRILAPVERLSEVARIVRACHERWDGAGYPDGRRGEAIPLAARIIFVCDAYHAMVTDRPYRPALPAWEARRRLIESAGTQFDPRVVDVFLGLDIPDDAEDRAA